MQAFFTPAKTSELQTILQTNKLESRLKNLFLLSPSVHLAFRNGHLRIFPPTSTRDQWNDETEAKVKTASKVYVSTPRILPSSHYFLLAECQYFVSRLSPEPCGSLFLSDGSHWDSLMQMFTMESHDPNQPLPDPFLLRTHHHIAASMYLFHVEERIAEGWPSPPLCMVHITLL